MVLYAYTCVCAFSLHREFPDRILGDKPLLFQGGFVTCTTGIEKCVWSQDIQLESYLPTEVEHMIRVTSSDRNQAYDQSHVFRLELGI
jgi:hypothetical protein